MAYVLVAHSVDQAVGGANITSTTIDTSAADLIIVLSSCWGSAASFGFTDTGSNTFTARTEQTDTVTRARIHYCQGAGIGSASYHITQNAGQYASVVVMAFSGSTATPYDAENGTTTISGTSCQPGTVTPAGDNEVFVTLVTQGAAGSSSETIDSSFVTPVYEADYSVGNAFGIAASYLIETTGTAKNPTWSWTGASASCVTMAAFKAAAGGGGGTNWGPWIAGGWNRLVQGV